MNDRQHCTLKTPETKIQMKNPPNYKAKLCALCDVKYNPRSSRSKYCDSCRPIAKSACDRQWRLQNKEKINKLRRQRRKEHPEADKEARRRWNATHPGYYRNEKKREAARLYYQKNRDRINAAIRQRRKEHPEYLKNYKKEHLLEHRTYEHKRRSRSNENGGVHTVEELKQLFETQNGLCFYCGQLLYKDFKDTYHIDHRIPLFRGGGNEIDNIALACASCNKKKHTMTAEEFIKKIEMPPIEVACLGK
jgi:hypothetical protein